MPRNNTCAWTPLMKAVMANMSILAIWYIAEYAQFGQLQWDRKGDDIVFVLYFLLTWALFHGNGRSAAER